MSAKIFLLNNYIFILCALASSCERSSVSEVRDQKESGLSSSHKTKAGERTASVRDKTILNSVGEILTEDEIVELVATSTPDQLIKIINSYSSPRDAFALVVNAFTNLTKDNPKLAIQYADMLNNSQAAEWAHSLIVLTVADSDPATAIVIAKAGRPELLKVAFKNIFTRWTEKDPRAAYTAWESLEPSGARELAGEVLIKEWLKLNPLEVFDFINSKPASSIKSQMLAQVVMELSKTDVKYGLDFLANSQSGEIKLQLVQTIINSFDIGKDLDTVISWLNNTSSGEVRTTAIVALIPKIGTNQIDLCNSLLEKLSPGTTRDHAVQALAAGLFENNLPENSIELALKLNEKADQDIAINSILSKWALVDPTLAVQYALNGSSDNSTAMRTVIEAWSRNHPKDVVKWLTGMKDNNVLSTISIPKAEIFQSLSFHDPSTAKAMLAENTSMFPFTTQNVEILASQWVRNDPVAATTWIQSLPNSQAKNRAFMVLAENWISYDSIQASKWIATLKNGSPRDNAIVAIVNATMQGDSESAYEWSNLINNIDLRNQVQNRIPPISK